MVKSFEFRNNNCFDFLRLLFAVFVLVTHSYALFGYSENDWLYQLTRQISFSQVGVFGFFSISGYLIFISLVRSENLINYFAKRVLRIFPALTILILVSVFVVAPIFVSGSSINLYSNLSTWEYLLNNIILQTKYTIDGLFENNPLPSIVNGSLWTIPYEFSCYVLISVFFLIKNKMRLIRIVLSFNMICFLIIFNFYLTKFSYWTPVYKINTELLLKFGGFFLMGSLIASFNDLVIKHKTLLLISSFILLTGSFFFFVFHWVEYIIFPIFIISFGLHSFKYISDISKIGDYSYGFYLYAFLIQQVIVLMFEPQLYMLMFLSFLITFIFALFSWYLIEKPTLKLKRFIY